MKPTPLSSTVTQIYSAQPDGKLFHYTSLSGAWNIARTRNIWATELRYMSDSSELLSSADRLAHVAVAHVQEGNHDVEVLAQFVRWVKQRFSDGHSQFVACFSEKGDVLSQWRGYCPQAKGISLGFHGKELAESAAAQGFFLVKCIYDRNEQSQLLRAVVKGVVAHALAVGKSADRHPDNSYHLAFEQLEFELLRVAAAMKSEAFSEEHEWRVVSEAMTRTDSPKIHYREGASMMVPYVNFELPQSAAGSLLLPTAYVGPTPNSNNSIRSLTNFLGTQVTGPFEVIASRVPYRTW